MIGRLLIGITVCFIFACAGTEGIETGLQNAPDRGWVRVISLLSSDAPSLAITHVDESPVTFAGRATHVTEWREQVAGDVTAWALQDGVTLVESTYVLTTGARATVLVMEGDVHPRVSWVNEEFEADDTVAHVRFINALPTDSVSASLDGNPLGGVLDASSASGWFSLTPSAESTLSLSVSGDLTEVLFQNIEAAAGTFVTLAAVPDDSAAGSRLLVFAESSQYQPLSSIVVVAEEAP